MGKAKIAEIGPWIYYIAENDAPIPGCGKWMYFFQGAQGLEFVKGICQKAIEDGIVTQCKHINTTEDGVVCFYISAGDSEAHKRVISFFIKNSLIRKTKAGKFYNISFKLDDQTRAGEYGNDFKAEIKLSEFIDMATGEWLS